MRRTFDDPDAPYHALRRSFVHKERPACTPPHLGPRPGCANRSDPLRRADVTGTALDGVSSRPNG